jgi:hypothetical protein
VQSLTLRSYFFLFSIFAYHGLMHCNERGVHRRLCRAFSSFAIVLQGLGTIRDQHFSPFSALVLGLNFVTPLCNKTPLELLLCFMDDIMVTPDLWVPLGHSTYRIPPYMCLRGHRRGSGGKRMPHKEGGQEHGSCVSTTALDMKGSVHCSRCLDTGCCCQGAGLSLASLPLFRTLEERVYK